MADQEGALPWLLSGLCYKHKMTPEELLKHFVKPGRSMQKTADLMGVDRKSLYNWLNKYGWPRARYASRRTKELEAGNGTDD